jgi:hypothetical protein
MPLRTVGIGARGSQRSVAGRAPHSSLADVGRLEGAAQHIEQVGTVHRHARRAELLAKCAPAHARDDPPALPAADDQKIRFRPDSNDCVLDAEHPKCHQRVGAEVEASADVAQHGRLLADDDFGAPPLQR